MALPTNSGSGDRSNQSGLPPVPRPRPAAKQEEEQGLSLPLPSAPLPQRPEAPREPARQERRPAPQPPSPDTFYRDDSFEQIPLEELGEDEDGFEEEWDTPPAPMPPPRPTPAPAPVPAPLPVEEASDYYVEPTPPPAAPRPTSPSAPEPETSDFVNKSKKKLIPFGGSKSDSKKRKKGDGGAFDTRENRKAQARMVQVGALTLLLGTVGFGLWNAVSPPVGVSSDEVNAMILANDASSSFPFEKGGAFATDFLSTYLTVTPEERLTGDPMLSYYYTGIMGQDGAETTIQVDGSFSQRLLTEPKVFKEVPLTEHSAAFVVGALVEPYNGDAPAGQPGTVSPAAPSAKWVFYNVNVYYDTDNDLLAITKDSPTLVPAEQLGASADIPEEKLPGTGEASDELAEETQSVVYGYVQAFAVSSPLNHTALDQYLIADPPPELLRGLDSQYELAGDPETAISYTAYPAEDNPNAVRLDLTVTWKDATIDAGSATYQSRYFMELVKESNGKYLVAQSSPKYYSMAEDE